MDTNKTRARQIQNEINDILFEFWDPIRLNDVLPRDEYEAYVAKVYRALIEGKGELEIVRLLTDIENSCIGCRASHRAKQEAAKRLSAIEAARVNQQTKIWVEALEHWYRTGAR